MKTRVERRERQLLIAQALEDGRIRSQKYVVKILAKSGIEVTQATASRDLEQLGAVRGMNSRGEIVYQLPETNQGRLDDLTLGVAEASRIIVIKTPPGAAQLIAGRLDRAHLRGVIGTIAGDDTIFTACDKTTPIRTIREGILLIASGGKMEKSRPSPRNKTATQRRR